MDPKMLIFLIPAAALAAGILIGTLKAGHHSHHHGMFGHKHGEATVSIDMYAFQSALYSLNPMFKTIYAITLLMLSVCMNNLYVSVLILLLSTFIIVVLGKLPFSRFLNLMTIPFVFLIVGTIVILLDFSWEPAAGALGSVHLFNFYINVTKTGLTTTVLLWGKCLGAISAMYMMSLTTPSGELFTVLERMHVPSLIIELMNMMYRFIFTMMDTQSRMKNAAESRLGYKDYRTSIKSFGSTASNLLVVSFKKANAYYDALESRGYDGRMHFLQEEKKVPGRERVLAALSVVYLFAVFFVMR